FFPRTCSCLDHVSRARNLIRGRCHLVRWHQRFRLASAVVLVDGRWVATQGRNRDVHVGEQRQIADQVLQFCVVCHIENAHVGVAAGHPPQMTPLALTLQVLGIGLLRALISLMTSASMSCGMFTFISTLNSMGISPYLRRYSASLSSSISTPRPGPLGRSTPFSWYLSGCTTMSSFISNGDRKSVV